MHYELVPEAVFLNLPHKRSAKFLMLADVAKKNFDQILNAEFKDASSSHPELQALRRFYGQTVNGIARQLGYQDIYSSPDGSVGDHQRFESDLAVRRTMLRLEAATDNLSVDATSGVNISQITKSSLRIDINKLEELIVLSELTEKHKTRLLKKLSELRQSLDQDNFDTFKMLTVVAAIATIIGGTSSGLANAPKAIAAAPLVWGHVQHMLSLVGDEELAVDAETDEQLLLSAPQKALPDYSAN